MAENEKVEYKDILREIDAPMTAAELTDLHRTEGWMMMGVVVATIRRPLENIGTDRFHDPLVFSPPPVEKIVYYFARKVA